MRRLAAVFLVAVVGLAVIAPAATAAESITIRKLDTTAFPKVTISALVSGPTPDLGSFSLRENGKIVRPADVEVVPIGKTDTPVGVVLVIDISGSMRPGGKLESAKDAARQFVSQKLENDQIAVVAFNSLAQVVSGFTNDAGALNTAIGGLAATGETALFDGVRTAATLFGDRPDLQPNIVLLSDGADTVSQNGLAEAEAAVLTAKASLFAVGLRQGGGEFDAASLTRLAQAGNGQYTETTDPDSLKGLYGNVQRAIQNQYEITYTSTATGSLAVDLGAAGLLTSAGPVNAGSVSQGSSATPEIVGTSWFAKPLGSSSSLAVIAGVGFLTVVLVVVSITALSRGGVPTLSTRLRPYGPAGGGAFETTPGSGEIELAQTAIVRRAVDATASLVRGRGILDALETKLEQADLLVRPAEALFFYVVSVLTFVIIGGFLGGIFATILALIVVSLVPVAVLNFLGARRRAQFTAQLPDVLRLLASSLRGGFSLLQAADAVAEQMEDPMGKELRRVLVEARLGRPLELAMEDSARRARSPDYDWAVMAIGIQREVGGNLAELLSTVAETMVARERLRREISTLTAEGRISAIVLAILPLAIGAVVYVLNPDYLDPLLHRTVGQAMLLGAVAAGIAGFVWMRKIVNIPT